MPAIDTYLTQVLERDGSDLHFLAGDPARVRQYGELKAQLVLFAAPLNSMPSGSSYSYSTPSYSTPSSGSTFSGYHS